MSNQTFPERSHFILSLTTGEAVILRSGISTVEQCIAIMSSQVTPAQVGCTEVQSKVAIWGTSSLPQHYISCVTTLPLLYERVVQVHVL